MQLTDAQVARADRLRDLIAAEEHKVRTGERRRAKAIKVGVELSDRCDARGIEGRLKHVSTTGAIIIVRDAATKQDIEIPNVEIINVEVY